jgi:Tfp pilus assembly protein PilP
MTMKLSVCLLCLLVISGCTDWQSAVERQLQGWCRQQRNCTDSAAPDPARQKF